MEFNNKELELVKTLILTQMDEIEDVLILQREENEQTNDLSTKLMEYQAILNKIYDYEHSSN